MKVMVTGNLGGFTQGQVLTDQAEIIRYYRAGINEGGSDKDVKDEDILKVINEIGGPDNPSADEAEDLEIERFMKLSEFCPGVM